MFFIGVMGIDTKEELLRKIPVQCPICYENHLSLLHSYNRLHFFFLPLFKWSYHYYLHCETCNSLYEIPKEKGLNISSDKNVEINYWDLSPIRETKICRSCKNTLQGEFEYCPYCGNRQRQF